MNVNKHSKVRAVGLSSCLALVALLGLAVFCPSTDGANAATSDTKTFSVNFNVLKLAKETRTADFYVNFLVSQTISIDMNDLAGEIPATVQPTIDGKTISAYSDFSVTTNSPQGLSVYVYSPDGTTALTGTESGGSIPTTTATASSLSGLTANTWGYNLSPVANATNAEGLQYKGLAAGLVPSSSDYSTGSTGSNTTANLRLTFGAKVDINTSADTYTKAVKVQAVASGNTTALINAAAADLDELGLQSEDGDTDETQEAELVEEVEAE